MAVPKIPVLGGHQHALTQIGASEVGSNQFGIAQRDAAQIGPFQPCVG
jgi:hypothetical protein